MSGVIFSNLLYLRLWAQHIWLQKVSTVLATNMEWRLLFLLFSYLVLSVIDYGMGILTLCVWQWEILEKNTKWRHANCWVVHRILQSEALNVWTNISETQTCLARPTYVSEIVRESLCLLIWMMEKVDGEREEIMNGASIR